MRAKRYALFQVAVEGKLVYSRKKLQDPCLDNKVLYCNSILLIILYQTCLSYISFTLRLLLLWTYSARPKAGVIANGVASGSKKPITTIDDVLNGLVEWLCAQVRLLFFFPLFSSVTVGVALFLKW